MSTAEILQRQVALFGEFSRGGIERLVSGSSRASFEARETIARRGDEATRFGILLRGSATASVLDGGGAGRRLGSLVAGDTFGEIALIKADAMLADIVAESPCEVLWIPVSLFQSIVAAEPDAAPHVGEILSERMRTLLADPAVATAGDRRAGDPHGLALGSERPEKVLVVNCGSSSLKYSFYDTADETRRAHGIVERIGIDGTRLTHRAPGGEVTRDLPHGGFADAFRAMVAELLSNESGVIGDAREVSVVVHRVVHGGEPFTEATIVTDGVLAKIEALNSLAPLHNPVNVAGIHETRRLFPAAPHVAVFDTAFHHTLPAHAYLYGLPYEIFEKHRVRRYGFHGSSHHYVALRAAQFLGRRPDELRLVTCHLGNGASLCAVDHGRSVDTTMGFTPAEGLIMGTRCGDVDAGVLAFLERTDGVTASQSEEMLNKKSGLLGLSGISSDLREILAAAGDGHRRALRAFHAYCYRVRKAIGAYVAAMGGVDAVVFTGGVGQGSAHVRALALQGLDGMGLRLAHDRNRDARGFDEACRISTDDSPAAVLVVPTDEERMMAREALRALGRSRITGALAAQKKRKIPVEVVAPHVHLAPEDVDALFGAGHALTRLADATQPGRFVCGEEVTIVGPIGRIERVRVVGPPRRLTQVEIASRQQFQLGLDAPIRESGDVEGTPGCVLEGPRGSLKLARGVLGILRHIHMTPEDALRHAVRDGSVVRVRIDGNREVVLGDVLVRVDPNRALAMHIGPDDGDADGIQTGAQASIDGVQTDG